MVIRDLSAPESCPQVFREEVRIAFVSDRFIAAVLDFLIFSPVVSFCVAGFLKEIKTYLLIDPQSFEASIIWFLFNNITKSKKLVQLSSIWYRTTLILVGATIINLV